MTMRKLWTTVGGAWAMAAATTLAAAPQITFDKTVYNFGSTSLVQSVTGTFTFQNTGDAVLDVQKPVTSCGCTVASVKPDKLPPGAKGELVFTLNLANVRGPAEKVITVPSNDPTNQQVRLAVKVDVHQLFEISPAVVMLGDVPQGATTNLTLLVKRNDQADCVIEKVETSGNGVTAQVEPVTDDKTQRRINVTLDAGAAARRVQEWVRITPAGAAAPLPSVFFHGRVVGDVTVQPEVVYWLIPGGLNWPGPSPELMTKRKLDVTASRPGSNLLLTNLVSSLPNVTVEVIPVEPGHRYTVVARMTAPPTTNLTGTISFETNIPAQPRVVVPITVNVLRR